MMNSRSGPPNSKDPDRSPTEPAPFDETLGVAPAGGDSAVLGGFVGTTSRLPIHTKIGPYRLGRVLGEGGMGTVFLAEQSEPFERRVALKVIRPGLDYLQIVARFETERRALARMNHARIAKIFDAGTTDDSRPYFVMEYVDGMPLTRHCDERGLSTRERIELIVEVCEAIQHAHQKGIIHRDLKPSNVLVGEENGRSVPKVIDFGIAKPVTQAGSSDEPIEPVTQPGMILGTLEYMSPEQLTSSDEGVDTRSDVYSLGVMLYELLTGTLPFDQDEFRRLGIAGQQRWLQERDPVRPSTRLSRLGEARETLAAKRQTTVHALTRQLRGDLDGITLMALARDRRQRYATAQELADDLRRYLRHEPVRASSRRRWYVGLKFVRRHRVSVAFAALCIGLVVGGLFFFWRLSRDLESQRDQISRHADAIEGERDLARAESRKLSDVRDFLVQMLTAVDPAQDGRDVKVVTLLERARESLQSSMESGEGTPAESDVGSGGALRDGAVEVSLRLAIARTYLGLGLLAESAEILEAPRVQGRIAAPLPERVTAPGEFHETLEVLALRAEIELRSGRLAEALELYQLAVDWCRVGEADQEFELDPKHWIHVRSGEAVALKQLNRLEESASVLSEVIERQKALGPVVLDTLVLEQNLARLQSRQGKSQEAAETFQRVFEGFRELAGADDPNTLLIQRNYGWALHHVRKYDDAERELQAAFERQGTVLGADHVETLITLNHWAGVVRRRGETTRAITLYDRLAEAAPRSFPEGDWRPLLFRRDRARALVDARDFVQAEIELLAVLPGLEKSFGAPHPLVKSTRGAIAHLYSEWGRPEQAAPFLPPGAEPID